MFEEGSGLCATGGEKVIFNPLHLQEVYAGPAQSLSQAPKVSVETGGAHPLKYKIWISCLLAH